MVARVTELESILGEPSKLVQAKVLPEVIPGMRAFLARSPLIAVAGETVELVGRLDVDTDVSDGEPVATLTMVPGINETLRINGTGRVDGDAAVVNPHQTFMHCAKAFVRSALWSAPSTTLDLEPGECDGLDEQARAFLAVSPFAAFGSRDGDGGTDCSPRGDPPGFARVLDAETLLLPERPGNKLADTLHNVLADPRVALRFLLPGSPLTLGVTGRAHITDDSELLAPLAVRDRPPKLGILVHVERVTLDHSAALVAGGVWDPATHAARAEVPTGGQIYGEKFARPGEIDSFATMIDDATAQDERENLY